MGALSVFHGFKITHKATRGLLREAGPVLTERSPDVAKPDMMAFHGSSRPLALIRAQSIVVKVIPHIAKEPASLGA